MGDILPLLYYNKHQCKQKRIEPLVQIVTVPVLGVLVFVFNFISPESTTRALLRWTLCPCVSHAKLPNYYTTLPYLASDGHNRYVFYELIEPISNQYSNPYGLSHAKEDFVTLCFFRDSKTVKIFQVWNVISSHLTKCIHSTTLLWWPCF